LFAKRAVDATLLKKDQAQPYEVSKRQLKKARKVIPFI
jgi:hypothetical protein